MLFCGPVPQVGGQVTLVAMGVASVADDVAFAAVDVSPVARSVTLPAGYISSESRMVPLVSGLISFIGDRLALPAILDLIGTVTVDHRGPPPSVEDAHPFPQRAPSPVRQQTSVHLR